MPPARLTATPSFSAAREAASVAPTDRRERSTISGDHGKPIRRCASRGSVPVATASTYSGVWINRRSSQLAAGASWTSDSGRIPSARIRSRSREYFAIGNLWPSGNGSTKWSE